MNALDEAVCGPSLEPGRPTFVTDYPSALSPLARPQSGRSHLCERWELLAGGMEIGTAYTELNDPEIQLSKFAEQLRGAEDDDEDATLRTLDADYANGFPIHASVARVARVPHVPPVPQGSRNGAPPVVLRIRASDCTSECADTEPREGRPAQWPGIRSR